MSWYREDSRWEKSRHIRDAKREWLAEARAIRDADPSKRTLLREAKRESLARLEDAARTEGDFEKVLARWDSADIAESWRVSRHESVALDKVEDYALPNDGQMFPVPFDHICWRQLLCGDFIDYIHDCIFEFHGMAGSRQIHASLKALKGQSRKRTIFYRAVRQWTPQHVASLLGQTDRNVRRVYGNIIKSVRSELFESLYERWRGNLPLTREQREFCDDYWENLGELGQARVMRKFEEGERQERKRGRRKEK